MYIFSIEQINQLNEELKNKLPILDHRAHLFASSINLLISGNYLEGYKKYKEYIESSKECNDNLEYKIIYFISYKLILQKQYYEAKVVLEDGIKLFSRDITLNNNLAVALFHLGEHELALERVKAALKIEPDNTELNINYQKLTKYLNLERKQLLEF